jgi:uncharacterized protein YndB with AHSA1/START domain
MRNVQGSSRVDSSTRLIEASSHAIYSAIIDGRTWARWLAPDGAVGEMEAFEARIGGRYRFKLTFQSASGKSAANIDIVDGRFVELVEDTKLVNAVRFVSDDPMFADEMLMTWSLAAAEGGTLVSITCENVPEAISKVDHLNGMKSTLDNLANWLRSEAMQSNGSQG